MRSYDNNRQVVVTRTVRGPDGMVVRSTSRRIRAKREKMISESCHTNCGAVWGWGVPVDELEDNLGSMNGFPVKPEIPLSFKRLPVTTQSFEKVSVGWHSSVVL